GPGGTVVTRPPVRGDRWDIRAGAARAAVSGLLTRVRGAAGM
ncbi:competence protein, partial [Rhodococcus rhodochrous]